MRQVQRLQVWVLGQAHHLSNHYAFALMTGVGIKMMNLTQDEGPITVFTEI